MSALAGKADIALVRSEDVLGFYRSGGITSRMFFDHTAPLSN